MEGRLNENGCLKILRSGAFKTCACPFSDSYCGDYCPLFSEPEKLYDTKFTDISLCHKTIRFTKFTDERQ